MTSAAGSVSEVAAQEARETRALAAVTRAIDETHDLRSILHTACAQVREALQVERCLILLLAEGGEELVPMASSGFPEDFRNSSRPVHIGEDEERLWQFVLGRRRVLAASEVSGGDPAARVSPGRDARRSIMAAPLLVKGKPLGILYVDDGQRYHEWTAKEKSLLGLLANQITLVVDNVRSYEEASRKAAQLIAINELSRAVSSSLNIDAILRSLAGSLPKIIPLDRASITIPDKRGSAWQTFLLCGPVSPNAEETKNWLSPRTVTSWVIDNREPRISTDLAKELVFLEDADLLAQGLRSRIVLPLVAKNRALGALSVESRIPNCYAEEDLHTLGLICGQVTAAIENSYLFENARRRTEEVSALHSLALDISKTLDESEVIRAALERIDQIVETQFRALLLFDDERKDFSSPPALGECPEVLRYLEMCKERHEEPIFVEALSGTVFIPDVSAHPDLLPLVPRYSVPTSLAAVPVRSKEDVQGVLVLVSSPGKGYRAREVELFEAVCNQVGIGVERSRLHAAAHKSASEFKALFELGQSISSSLELGSILGSVVESARKLIATDVSFIALPCDPGGSLRILTHVGTQGVVPADVDIVDLSVLLPADERTTARPVVLEDLRLESRFNQAFRELIVTEQLVSGMVVPLTMNTDVLGIILVANRKHTRFTDDDVTLLLAFANEAAIAVRNAQLHREVSHLAITDGLTDLLNHRYFYQRLSEEFKRARAFGRPLCLLFIDVDNLRVVNDTHGHLRGDRVLRELGQLIRQSVRGTDIVARYGGDEFTVILPEASEHQAEMLAKRLQNAVSRAALLGPDSQGAVTISIGIARLTSEVSSESQLVSRADQAAYRAKGAGRNAVAVYGRP